MNLIEGATFDLGSHSFSEEAIISFARINDPLPFHISKEEAKKSRFKKLVCSGSQAFNYFYVNRWIPQFGSTVEAGLEVNHWKFIAPIYHDQEVHGRVTIESIKTTKCDNEMVMSWFFSFKDSNEMDLQTLQLKILHQKKIL